MAAMMPPMDVFGGGGPSQASSAPDASATRRREDLRARRREIEKQSRHRRERRLREMRERAATLRRVLRCLSLEIALRPLLQPEQESVAELASALDAIIDSDSEEEPESADLDDQEDGDGDDDVERRLLPFLRRSMAMTADAKALRDERETLVAQIRRRQRVEPSVRTAIAARRADLDDDCVQWGAVWHAAFTPWSGPAIATHISESLETIHRFAATTDHVTTGHEFLGWSDSRRLDPVSGQFQFSFSKTFPHTNATQLFERFWEMQFSGDKLRRYNLGLSTKVRVDVVQRVSRDIAIQRRDVQYAGASTRSHTVLLLLRQRTPTGFMACLRTVAAPAIQSALTIDSDAAWVNHFHWTHIDTVTDEHGVAGCRVSFCGSLATKDTALAHRWMLEVVFMLVRGETTLVGRQRLTMY